LGPPQKCPKNAYDGDIQGTSLEYDTISKELENFRIDYELVSGIVPRI